ncbi:hypothetical protein Vretimale_17867 [Volvox reticuliferus]|uniref:Uncharacterized protein n=1 Tax=Volvox reticuliferus TaxID=1737510 RepID=A0A8J4GVQ2_9CHLO|nr:hypothetical protein Vretimale_17867 [Volvox reticuliferus]
MGTTWSRSESWKALVTKEEVRDAVRGFEAWQKAQEDLKLSMSVQRSAPSTGPLLERIGGPDVVRRTVEAFCRKLYADEKLMVFLEHTDMTSLRAKQVQNHVVEPHGAVSPVCRRPSSSDTALLRYSCHRDPFSPALLFSSCLFSSLSLAGFQIALLPAPR